MSDLFWDKVPDAYRHRIIDVIESTPQHEYQVLTKRPDIMLEYSKRRKLPSNFWAGTSIENERNKWRIDYLKQVDAEIRFISAEPLIGELDLSDLSGIHWVITGGESGHHMWNDKVCERRGLVRYDRTAKRWNVREDRVGWIRSVRDNCLSQGVKYFHKQWGGNYPEAAGRMLDGGYHSDIPRLPGGRNYIDNAYLRHVESKKQTSRDELLELSLMT